MENKEAGTPPPIPSREGVSAKTRNLSLCGWGNVFQVFKSFYNETYFERHATFMDGKLMLLLWSCTVSMFPLGGLLGSLLVGLLVDSCEAALLPLKIHASKPHCLWAFVHLVERRSLLGHSHHVLKPVPKCISYSALPMYLGELAPKNLRGMVGTMTEVFVIVGVFLAQIFSLQAILGNPAGWPVLLALTGVPALLQLLTLPFFPESPRYSLIQKGDEATARQALRRLRGHTDMEAELEDMRAEARAECAEGHLSVLHLCALRSLRWQLLSIIVLMAGQQLSGINAINYYADTIYTSAGVEAAHSQYVTVGSGVVNIVMTITSAVLVERLGRRHLLLAGYGICGSACLVLTVVLLFQNRVPELSYLGIICVFAYIVGHSIGPSPVPSVVRTEIFLQSSRRAAFMVDGAVHWLTNFIIGFLFPSIQFIIFAGICLLTAIYIYVVIPETKGKTFVEINRIFAKRNRVKLPEEKKEETIDAGPPTASPAKETSF
uniref:Solute carrier family 2, facilitated glucose transporter member 5 n=1 Tax=Gorilla gorilla gorilla TaxID=9595 RepID=G3RAZ9_GORGO